MLKIPYGESSFKKVVEEGYFYQDRTAFIQKMENRASFIYYLRPRRFGKSLFVTMLHMYYALEYKPFFEKLFGHLDIGKNPTPLANQYMVLSLEFSSINTDTQKHTYDGFLFNVKSGTKTFLVRYSNVFPTETHDEILNHDEPNLIIRSLVEVYNQIKLVKDLPKIYLVIDEYDHFANELISFDFKYFEESVSRNGFVRKFYEAIKMGTRDQIIDRLFLTGVSPVTLDSMTSGFNIGSNLSLVAEFHNMMGFTGAEVQGILHKIGVSDDNMETVMADLKDWYNGYLFTLKAKESVYNPDMVLYFAQQYQPTREYPTHLLDPNIATDYSKVQQVFKIQRREAENLKVLETLREHQKITAELTIQFSFERPFTHDDLVSLLFYMGFLTMKEEEVGGYIFRFPNYVIERLYANYFVAMLQTNKGLPIDNSQLNAALREIGKFGNPQPFYDEVMKIVVALSTRDTQAFTENTLKAIFISVLMQQQFYYVHSEYEDDRHYVDVFLEGIRGKNARFDVAFELKYVKKSEKIDVNDTLDAAEIQLKNYMTKKKFLDRPNLKAFVVLVQGTELHQREMSLN
jgi:hypothetical protein